jgi:diadenosine tetraphosphate (Ap4A) HIT family hydrolase
VNVKGCLACDANAGRIEVPGGTIAEAEHWHADHCIGPFGLGAVLVKTKEHVESLWELPDAAATELGPFLRIISGAIVDLDPKRYFAGPPEPKAAAAAAETLRNYLRKP